MDAAAYRGGRLGDGETHCSKVRSDNVSDGPSLRSQAAIGPAVYPSLEQKGARPPPTPLLSILTVLLPSSFWLYFDGRTPYADHHGSPAL